MSQGSASVKTNLIVDEAENKFHIENYQDQATIKKNPRLQQKNKMKVI
ncbi:MAG: hypothetical protein CM15mV95_320 [Caudoviricetes sp.]|nr:MAG: hypothetical protein CM15mV95_320 [Caudoviricetes sp.]